MSRPASAWAVPRPYGARSLAVLLIVLVAAFFAAQRVEIGRMLSLTGEGVLAAVGLRDQSQVLSGLGTIARSLFPPQISERTEVARIEGFDRQRLPWFSHVETVETHDPKLNPQTLQMEEVVDRREVLVEPFGYLWHVAVKMLETFEIAIWATLLAIVLSAPLAWCSAKNYTPNRVAYTLARSVVGTGVAPGSASTDATNVGQVQGMVKEGVDSANAYTDTVAAQGLPLGKAYTDATAARLQGQIDDTARRAYAGIAGVAAMEAAPLVPGKVSYAVGLGNYRSESAVGGSLRHTAQSGRYSVTLGVGATSAGVVTRVALTGVFD